jgi:hypothetical protein
MTEKAVAGARGLSTIDSGGPLAMLKSMVE